MQAFKLQLHWNKGRQVITAITKNLELRQKLVVKDNEK